MPKFVLIDNSIVDLSGHHYQYAMYCLKVASEMGYETFLATNKKNKEIKNLHWKVIPAYSYTFYKNEEYQSFITNIYHKFENSKHKVFLSILLRIFGRIIVKKLLNRNEIDLFSKDTKELFNQISLEKGDFVFIPTTGLVELFGISDFAKSNTNSKNATWHFLFRRNIFYGSPEKYSFVYIKLRLLTLAFKKFFKNQNLKTKFYTDSDDLTLEYDMLGVTKFYTLPVPHTIPKPKEKKLNGKIIISYLGDARSEKGYQYLPHIVQDLWEDYLINDKASFVIQSNFNLPEGEAAAVVAKNQLEFLPFSKIKLIENPLNLEEYRKLLSNSDVIILPYEQPNYYARSSGILVEALAYGIPVLVPQGTWLSRQFINEVYQYQRSLKNKLHTIQSFQYSDLEFYYNDKQKISEKNDNIILNHDHPIVQCSVELTLPGSLMLITVYFQNENTTSAINISATQLTKNKIPIIIQNSNLIERGKLPFITAVFPLHNLTQNIILKFGQPYENSFASISKLEIDILEGKNLNKIPISSVGITYTNPEEISDKLRNILDNYSHYYESARSFSDSYYQKHNAKSLIQKLENSLSDLKQLSK